MYTHTYIYILYICVCVCVCVYEVYPDTGERRTGDHEEKQLMPEFDLKLIFLTREPIPLHCSSLCIEMFSLSGKSFPSSLLGKSCPISSGIAEVKLLP